MVQQGRRLQLSPRYANGEVSRPHTHAEIEGRSDDYSADKITMYWSWKGQKLYTEFSQFSPNGRAMTQLEDASENPTVRSRRRVNSGKAV
jgi:hypothetical protein